MNEIARAAYIIAQAALLNAEMAAMQAADREAELRHGGTAYGEKQYQDMIANYSCLEHNSVLQWLRGE